MKRFIVKWINMGGTISCNEYYVSISPFHAIQNIIQEVPKWNVF